eukprot:1060120-Rhodomonas_salina.1
MHGKGLFSVHPATALVNFVPGFGTYTCAPDLLRNCGFYFILGFPQKRLLGELPKATSDFDVFLRGPSNSNKIGFEGGAGLEQGANTWKRIALGCNRAGGAIQQRAPTRVPGYAAMKGRIVTSYNSYNKMIQRPTEKQY